MDAANDGIRIFFSKIPKTLLSKHKLIDVNEREPKVRCILSREKDLVT